MTCLDCSSLYKYGYGSQLSEQLTGRGEGDNCAQTYDVGASSNILLSTTLHTLRWTESCIYHWLFCLLYHLYITFSTVIVKKAQKQHMYSSYVLMWKLHVHWFRKICCTWRKPSTLLITSNTILNSVPYCLQLYLAKLQSLRTVNKNNE